MRYQRLIVLLVFQTLPFLIIDQNTVASSWDGSPLVLQVNENANMPQTPNGSVIFAYQNEATQNNLGTISLTSGGTQPEFKNVPALTTAPSIIVNNWRAQNLSITNISANTATPIRIQAVGPGMPGTDPAKLPIGETLNLPPGATAENNSLPAWMQLVFSSSSGDRAVFVLIGGPLNADGENGYAIIVNAEENTGPGTDKPPPEGYFATTTANTYTYQFNWNGALVFVANMSSGTVRNTSVTLRQL